MKRLLLILMLSSTQLDLNNPGKYVADIADNYCVKRLHLKDDDLLHCNNAVIEGFFAGVDFMLRKLKALPGGF